MSWFYILLALCLLLNVNASCDDGIQDGDEEGIDCGGTSCPACEVISTTTTVVFPNVDYDSACDDSTKQQEFLDSLSGLFTDVTATDCQAGSTQVTFEGDDVSAVVDAVSNNSFGSVTTAGSDSYDLNSAYEFAVLADPSCEEGEYTVDAISTGVTVDLDYDSSSISKSDGVTYLNLDFIVPSMYFHEHTAGSKTFDRSVQITFHDRNATSPETGACYTTRDNNDDCPGITESYSTVVDENDGCLTRVTGALPWDAMMRYDYHDANRIEIWEGEREINGFMTETWEVYMMAIIETWAGYDISSDEMTWDEGTYQLNLNDERYNYYEIPFRTSWPQAITIEGGLGPDFDGPPITVFAPMLILYVVIEQKVVDINFNPDTAAGEKFGQIDLVIKTQVQEPFGLLTPEDPVAPAKVYTSETNIESVTWVPNAADPPSVCANGNVVDGGNGKYYCEQEWPISIVPEICDVNGVYQLEFWAVCYDDSNGCPLDNLAPSEQSNSYSTILDFTVAAQNFCPQVLDEITVAGYIGKYTDPLYDTTAQPGVNIFSNDDVYFETTYQATSEKSGVDVALGDDTLIEFVVPYAIIMTVTLEEQPLQTEIVTSNGDVTCLNADCTIYQIVLCNTTQTDYPYSIEVGERLSCFDNVGWNAENYLDFEYVDNNIGSNTIDDNEVGFKIRLDERVIPIDLPNSVALVTIEVLSEIYYIGNENYSNGRRRMQTEKNKHRQTYYVADTFTSDSNYDLEYCLLNDGNDPIITMLLDIEMDVLEIPTSSNVNDEVFRFRYVLADHYGASVDDIEILELDVCDNEGCRALFGAGVRRSLASTNSFVRYYLKINGQELANNIQLDLYHYHTIYNNADFQNKIVTRMIVDQCDNELSTYSEEHFSEFTFGEDIIVEDDAAFTFFTTLVFAFLCLLY